MYIFISKRLNRIIYTMAGKFILFFNPFSVLLLSLNRDSRPILIHRFVTIITDELYIYDTDTIETTIYSIKIFSEYIHFPFDKNKLLLIIWLSASYFIPIHIVFCDIYFCSSILIYRKCLRPSEC